LKLETKIMYRCDNCGKEYEGYGNFGWCYTTFEMDKKYNVGIRLTPEIWVGREHLRHCEEVDFCPDCNRKMMEKLICTT